MDLLLTTSSEERKLRCRIRGAATLEGALDALLQAEGFEAESEEEAIEETCSSPKEGGYTTQHFTMLKDGSEAGQGSEDES